MLIIEQTGTNVTYYLYDENGSVIGFEYNGVEYGIEGHNGAYDIWIYDVDTIAINITLEDVMNFELDGVKICDLILDADITERIMRKVL